LSLFHACELSGHIAVEQKLFLASKNPSLTHLRQTYSPFRLDADLCRWVTLTAITFGPEIIEVSVPGTYSGSGSRDIEGRCFSSKGILDELPFEYAMWAEGN
jgi:hypothetical protein